uniref:ILTat VSG-1.22 protein n=1 Tax=Trypanosoma brucei TaxID=5691 RepID=O96766_9TRYP|nr:ILTat VSG-1.22 [Trypanosoma brucei]
MDTAQVFALFYMATVMAAGTKNKASQAVSDPCSEIHFDEQLANYFENEVSAATTQLDENQNFERSWKLLQYLQMDHQKSKGAAALAAYASTINIRTAANVKAASGELLTAASLLRQRAANVSAALQLQGQGVIKLGTPDIDNGAKSITHADAGCNYAAISKTVPTQRCTPPQQQADTITAADMQPDKLDELQLITEAYTTTITIAASAYSKGTPATGHTVYTYGNCQSTGGSASAQLGDTHALGIHVKTIGTKAVTEKTTLQPSSSNKCPDEGTTAELTPIKRLARAICLARKASLAKPKALSRLQYSDLQTDTDFKRIAAIFLSRNRKQLDPEKDSQEINELIKETYGPNEEHFHKSYVEALDNKKWQFKIKESKIEGTVNALANGVDAGLATAYYASKRQSTCGQAAADTPIVSSDVEKCKGKTQDDCRTADECEMRDGECNAKVAKTAEPDSKTNTTGNNSFAIKTSTLLLAVLLF